MPLDIPVYIPLENNDDRKAFFSFKKMEEQFGTCLYSTFYVNRKENKVSDSWKD